MLIIRPSVRGSLLIPYGVSSKMTMRRILPLRIHINYSIQLTHFSRETRPLCTIFEPSVKLTVLATRHSSGGDDLPLSSRVRTSGASWKLSLSESRYSASASPPSSCQMEYSFHVVLRHVPGFHFIVVCTNPGSGEGG